MRTLVAFSLVVPLLVSAPALVVGDETAESYPKIYCVTFHKEGDAGCAAIEKAFMGKLRKEFAEKNVLFMTADLTSKATRHQARLLLNALSLGDAWQSYSNKPGSVVLCDPEWGSIKGTFTPATKEAEARALLTKALKDTAVEEEEDDDEDDE